MSPPPRSAIKQKSGSGDPKGGGARGQWFQSSGLLGARQAGGGPALRCRKDHPACPPVCSQIAIKSVPFLNTDAWSKELLSTLTKPSRTQQEELPEKVGPAPGSPRPVDHRHHPQDTQVLRGTGGPRRDRGGP